MNTKNSIQITDKDILNNFINTPNFPFLISFPRTGSHWLRMIMELYFGKPSLVRVFYYKEAKDFTCYHRHDEDLSIEHENIIYLYRNPVDTIYSQLNYHNEDTNNLERIKYWSELYGKHLSKWLLDEKFTKKKTILTYEAMKNSLEDEFKKVCDHYKADFDKIKLQSIAEKITKEEVKNKTRHDIHVINRSNEYDKQRLEFKKKYYDIILEIILAINTNLNNYFNFN